MNMESQKQITEILEFFMFAFTDMQSLFYK